MIQLKPLPSQPMQQGFSLFEVLIAALILAVAVAGVMGLHTRNLQDTAAMSCNGRIGLFSMRSSEVNSIILLVRSISRI